MSRSDRDRTGRRGVVSCEPAKGGPNSRVGGSRAQKEVGMKGRRQERGEKRCRTRKKNRKGRSQRRAPPLEVARKKKADHTGGVGLRIERAVSQRKADGRLATQWEKRK